MSRDDEIVRLPMSACRQLPLAPAGFRKRLLRGDRNGTPTYLADIEVPAALVHLPACLTASKWRPLHDHIEVQADLRRVSGTNVRVSYPPVVQNRLAGRRNRQAMPPWLP